MANLHTVLMLGEYGGQTKQRFMALKNLGYDVDIVKESAESHLPGINYHPSFFDRVFHKLGYPRDRYRINQKVLKQLAQKKYHLLWVEKSLALKPVTLKKIKKDYPDVKIAWYSADDMFAKHNQSHYFVKGIPYYDIIFTTKTYNCDASELPALGAKSVIFVGKGFDKSHHHPVEVTPEEVKKFGANVGFVGTFEKDRAEKMLFLADHGIKVRVWGNGWSGYLNKHSNLIIENKPVYGEDYQKTICATKINLCFLRKMNRDQQTDRTVELPAMGAFMLAERTKEHLGCFVEGKEATFFDIDNPQELLEKVQYYLSHDEERQNIAKAGRERCLQSNYSHEARWQFMLERLERLSHHECG